MLNDLLLLSGNDIPFIEAQVNIHQPSIKEIAYIGEESFFIGCEILNFTKDSLSMEDRQQLQQFSDCDQRCQSDVYEFSFRTVHGSLCLHEEISGL